jgi:hypothetical protein
MTYDFLILFYQQQDAVVRGLFICGSLKVTAGGRKLGGRRYQVGEDPLAKHYLRQQLSCRPNTTYLHLLACKELILSGNILVEGDLKYLSSFQDCCFTFYGEQTALGSCSAGSCSMQPTF